MKAHDRTRRHILVTIATMLTPALAALTTLAGCAGNSVQLTTAPDSSAVERYDERYDDRSWATVLRENVKDDLVDYGHLSGHRGPLDAYLRMIAVIGPGSSPAQFATADDLTAYYINGYNAAVLAAVLEAKIPPSMHDIRRPNLDRDHALVIDGESRSLLWLRRQVFDVAQGDMRVAFALCDAAKGSPPLCDRPFRGFDLNESLRRVSERAMDNHAIVYVDHEAQRLRLSQVLISDAEAFLAYCRRETGAGSPTPLNVVLMFANDVRRQWLNTAVGYPTEPLPFDRRLNLWPPEKD